MESSVERPLNQIQASVEIGEAVNLESEVVHGMGIYTNAGDTVDNIESSMKKPSKSAGKMDDHIICVDQSP